MMPSEPHRTRTLVDRAFDPNGPIYDGPTSKGRRKYDQTFWLVRVIKDVGFPIAAAWWVASSLLPAMDRLREAQERNTAVIRALVCHLDKTACSKTLMLDSSDPGAKDPEGAP